jgi:hypothetical protein
MVGTGIFTILTTAFQLHNLGQKAFNKQNKKGFMRFSWEYTLRVPRSTLESVTEGKGRARFDDDVSGHHEQGPTWSGDRDRNIPRRLSEPWPYSE